MLVDIDDLNRYTYNGEVDDFHTYYVGEQSMLVHNKKCKNPNGRKGGEAHQLVTSEVIADIENRDLVPDTEHQFFVTDGEKNSRFADVVALKYVDGKEVVVEIHQVGKTLSDRTTPVARERRAIADIESNPDNPKVIYHPYDGNKKKGR